MTESLVADVFGVSCKVIADPITGSPLYIPCPPSSSEMVPPLAGVDSSDQLIERGGSGVRTPDEGFLNASRGDSSPHERHQPQDELKGAAT